jgi:hypothetical protein
MDEVGRGTNSLNAIAILRAFIHQAKETLSDKDCILLIGATDCPGVGLPSIQLDLIREPLPDFDDPVLNKRVAQLKAADQIKPLALLNHVLEACHNKLLEF